MQISIEEAYTHACQIIGDLKVKDAVMHQALNEKDEFINGLKEQLKNAIEQGFLGDDVKAIVINSEEVASKGDDASVSNGKQRRLPKNQKLP